MNQQMMNSPTIADSNQSLCCATRLVNRYHGTKFIKLNIDVSHL